MLSNIQMPSAKAVISAAASAAAATMVVRSIAGDLIPRELQHYLMTKLRRFLGSFSNELTLVIDEFDGLNPNQLFRAAEVYLGTITAAATSEAAAGNRVRVSKPEKEKEIRLSMERNAELVDTFGGVRIKWRKVIQQIQSKYISDPTGDHYGSALRTEVEFFELSFHNKHKDKVIDVYLPSILEKSKIAEEEKKTLKLFTLLNGRVRIHGRKSNPWQSVNLDHPATFDTVAMAADDARMAVLEDLRWFVKRKELYRKAGKAWKRGYLLYGPPGTGKSSLIAAMANYLKFDVYDLELTDVRSDSMLRKLLIWTANRSILVVEDIDCSIELEDRVAPPPRRDPYGRFQEARVTLSGLLNFTDGLWSSCGDERIIVFTTNHKDRLDPALLRPGRMDVYIHMSYCTPSGFRMLVSNYLGITEHPHFLEVEKLLETRNVTPAEVAEELMKSEEPDSALKGLIGFLEERKECEEIKDVELEGEACGLDAKPKLQHKGDGGSEK